MFKPTPSLQKMLRRLPLSTKQAGKEYYKGNRVGKLGTITRYGNFTPDWSLIRTFVYPELGTKNCELTPFVAEDMEKTRQTSEGFETYPKRLTGKDYLDAWKLSGGYDLVENDAYATGTNMPEPFEEKAGEKS
ncbi:hypothetical protein BDU57DRAFT_485160 [Ampelomyces quisqualis]|uniref:Mitochondrial ribosomal protein L27-domain-containing protein n=1 Tax=Ampelomyces quisqualis TaxID=50730 RepID=A0A6A5Q7G6_AMPQU|nr:hypothetical protein BDU57DRAFT_485160 [Ampelomyces quisqualis]